MADDETRDEAVPDERDDEIDPGPGLELPQSLADSYRELTASWPGRST